MPQNSSPLMAGNHQRKRAKTSFGGKKPAIGRPPRIFAISTVSHAIASIHSRLGRNKPNATMDAGITNGITIQKNTIQPHHLSSSGSHSRPYGIELFRRLISFG